MSLKIVWLTAAIIVSAFSLSQGQPSAAPPPCPYLALFTFQKPLFTEPAEFQMAQLNASPYDGVAVWFQDAYALNSPQFDTVLARAKALRRLSRKDLWFVSFVNRVVQPKHTATRPPAVPPQGQATSDWGVDLDNSTGALADFLLKWRWNLRLAKAVSSPGICLDPEFYNDYNIERIRPLAVLRKDTEDGVKERLRAIGSQMADIVAQEYPNATIWTLATRFPQPSWAGGDDWRTERVGGFLIAGLLERARQAHTPLKLVEGGEELVRYLPGTVANLLISLGRQQDFLAPWRARYPALVPGGTVAPWIQIGGRPEWMSAVREPDSIDAFEPLFRLLMQKRAFVWIYAADYAYDVWNDEVSTKVNLVLSQARHSACTPSRLATRPIGSARNTTGR